MSINSEIRKIAKAWGVDTKGSSIKDALKDLRTNLPFGTKTEMVEILPEQSVTGEARNGMYGVIRREGFESNTFVLSKGKKYIIVLNGKTYESESSTFNFGNNADDIIIGDKDISDFSLDNPNIPFSISSGEMNTGGATNQIMWRTDLGKTITIAIYEEKEVVQPIDIKYLPIEELKEALGIGGEA